MRYTARRWITSEVPPRQSSNRKRSWSSGERRDSFFCTLSRTRMVARFVSRTTSSYEDRKPTALLYHSSALSISRSLHPFIAIFTFIHFLTFILSPTQSVLFSSFRHSYPFLFSIHLLFKSIITYFITLSFLFFILFIALVLPASNYPPFYPLKSPPPHQLPSVLSSLSPLFILRHHSGSYLKPLVLAAVQLLLVGRLFRAHEGGVLRP